MNPSSDSTLFARAAVGEKTERTPIWLMRQAGRSDPEYCRLREQSGLPLEELFRHPEWAARLSLLPRRIGVDAIIFYQDILTPLSPMGAHFIFRPGPQLATPLRWPEAAEELHPYDAAAGNPFVGETFARLQAELDGTLPVLGFAGAPLTLLVFLVEGQSFGHRAGKAMDFLRQHGEAAHRLLEKLTAMTIGYLQYQASLGAAAVQLFESAAYLLDEEMYAEFALPYQRQIFAALRGKVKTIMFARDWPHLDSLAAAGADILSLPKQISIAQARAQLGEGVVLQGNLDNHLLLQPDWSPIETEARRILEEGGQHAHIFNLNHGLLKETPFDNVVKLVEYVRNYRRNI